MYLDQIFDIGNFLELNINEKYKKYLEDYVRSSILKLLHNSYYLDKILDENAYLEGLSRIKEFISDFNKFKEFINIKADRIKIEILKLQDFIDRFGIN